MFLEVTRRLRLEGFATASVQTTALWFNRYRAISHAFKGQTTALGVDHNPVQDIAALMGGNIGELS